MNFSKKELSILIEIVFSILFAIFSTLFNLLTQRVVLSIDQTNLFFFFAISLGTIVGLVIKFFLDKFYIFFDKKNDISYHCLKLCHLYFVFYWFF